MFIILDKKSDNSTNSRRSRKSSGSVKLNQQQVLSDEISLSQLELMANKKKINKKTDLSVTDIQERNESMHGIQSDHMQPDTNRFLSDQIRPPSMKSSGLSTISSSTMSEERERRKIKLIAKENKNDAIRKEKSELLYKFNKANSKGKWSSLRLDMNCSLEEIRNEYQRVINAMQNERSVSFFKRMLLLGVQGIEMLNNKFDPVGVDLDGWSEAMGYSLENQEYDDVLSELCEKYKGVGQMSPEIKLIFMIISSATMFTISKKITKLDSSDAFKNIIGNFVNNEPSKPAQPQTVFNPDGNMSDTTEDYGPSKINDPNTVLNKINPGDNIDINNILRTMNERKLEKMQDEGSDELFKNIALNNTAKRKGRPKKTKSKVQLNI